MRFLPILIVLLLNAYLEFSLVGNFKQEDSVFWVLSIALLIPFLSQLWMLLIYFKSENHVELLFEDFFKKLAFLSMGLISFLFIFTLSRDLLSSTLQVFNLQLAFLNSERMSLGIIILSFFTVIYGYFNAKFVIKTPTIEVALPKLPDAFHGFKIVQLSDIHFGTGPSPSQVKKIFQRAMSLKPDLIVLTGDIIDGTTQTMRSELNELKKLHAPFGIYAVMGNHEYYWSARDASHEMQLAGIKLLMNESILIEKDGAQIELAGVDDPASQHFNGQGPILPPAKTADSTRILLAHQPGIANKASDAGFHFQISGHTHGGQFFPWNLAVKKIYPVSGGLGKIKDIKIYVNHGTGYWGPPIRLGTTSEITKIVLTPLKDSLA